MLLLSSAGLFQNYYFSKNSFRNTTRVSSSLDPDQDRQNVGPNLSPNCLQRLSAGIKSLIAREELKLKYCRINKKRKKSTLSASVHIIFS